MRFSFPIPFLLGFLVAANAGAEPKVTDENPGRLGILLDVSAEMVRLADEQIRFDAMSRMLSKVYQQVRASVRGG